jgi:hemerythrin
MKTSKGESEIGEIVNEIVDYTKFHFSTEEKRMADRFYPGLFSQKGEQKAFTNKAIEYQNQIKSGNLPCVYKIIWFHAFDDGCHHKVVLSLILHTSTK